MSETRFTPRPWRLSGPDDFGDYTIQPPEIELAIAAAVNWEMRRMGGKRAEHEANARLIAAAPDMFAALQAVQDWMERTPQMAGHPGPVVQLSGYPKDAVDAAVLKAALAQSPADNGEG